MVLFPPPFYFVFDISNLLSYIQNNELARPVMGTMLVVVSLSQTLYLTLAKRLVKGLAVRRVGATPFAT